MSDQGDSGPVGAPNGDGQQAPQYGFPSGYALPPEYAPPQYGDPSQYGPQPPPYGEPTYPGPEHGHGQQQFTPYTGAAPANDGRGSNRTGLWAAVVVTVLAVAGVGAYFLFSGGGASASTPEQAVAKLLDAAESGDVGAATAVLCRADIAVGTAAKLESSGRVTSYTVGKVVRSDGSHASVRATVSSTTTSAPETETLPVKKEGGTWKVCFTDSLAGLQPGVGVPSVSAPSPVGPSITVPSITVPSITVPSITVPSITVPSIGNSLGTFCASSANAFATAETYVGTIEIGAADLAQGCVYKNSVPRSVTIGIAAKKEYYAPTATSPSGPVFKFTSLDRLATVELTVTKESDGKYYVTKVEVH